MTAGSAEQAAGVSQISRAIGQVDQVTQRNAAAAEELSSTSQELAAQASALRQLMTFFRVSPGSNAPTGPAPAPEQRGAFSGWPAVGTGRRIPALLARSRERTT